MFALVTILFPFALGPMPVRSGDLVTPHCLGPWNCVNVTHDIYASISVHSDISKLIPGSSNVTQMASRLRVNPAMIHQRKPGLLDGIPGIFESSGRSKDPEISEEPVKES